jgi:hypothetical protein
MLVNPRESRKWLERAPGDFIARAKHAGIELLLGSHSVTNVLRRAALLAK